MVDCPTTNGNNNVAQYAATYPSKQQCLSKIELEKVKRKTKVPEDDAKIWRINT